MDDVLTRVVLASKARRPCFVRNNRGYEQPVVPDRSPRLTRRAPARTKATPT